MKREYILLLAGILLLSFTGCGRENPFNYADSDLSGMEKSARDENSSNKEQKNDDDENYGGSGNMVMMTTMVVMTIMAIVAMMEAMVTEMTIRRKVPQTKAMYPIFKSQKR